MLKISRHPISLDRPVGESEDSYFGDFIEDEKADNPVESATQEMLKDKIEQVLKTLTYREREIIKLRYGIGDGYTYTLEEVGRIFKVTRERVRQVEAKAIRKLQHPVRARKLEGFLPGLRRGKAAYFSLDEFSKQPRSESGLFYFVRSCERSFAGLSPASAGKCDEAEGHQTGRGRRLGDDRYRQIRECFAGLGIRGVVADEDVIRQRVRKHG